MKIREAEWVFIAAAKITNFREIRLKGKNEATQIPRDGCQFSKREKTRQKGP